MPVLPDLQASIRRALVAGERDALEGLLVGGCDAGRRLAIHQRHYATSLITALLDRFPATRWLVGSAFVTDAARDFIRLSPPTRPCIAEYGDGFPAFMATRTTPTEIPYLRQFSELEWHLGRVALAVDGPPLSQADLSGIDATALMLARVVFQPGIHYFRAEWAVDELISLFLTDDAPDRFSLQPGDIWLELRGARGELRMNRLGQADWAFRGALAGGERLGDAAVAGLEIDGAFAVGQAFLGLVADGLLVRIDGRPSKVPHE